ncbi:MAG: hypothetical protein ACM31E_09350 [Fibrobacterota bacterium]
MVDPDDFVVDGVAGVGAGGVDIELPDVDQSEPLDVEAGVVGAGASYELF